MSKADISWQTEADTLIFSGVLNRDTVPELWNARSDWLSTDETLTIDLSGLERVDSAGVAMLLQAKRQLLEQQRKLQLHSPSDQLRAIAEVSGATKLLDFS
ncbi:lipid asymmetry maintenance protein MlaB [Pseudidiomarina sp.]|uniref:STAS domain-containing protein n=1 Tax=Pseudidiomarina sp. TaxID=2081707 RepID=UPI00299ED4A4|nr:STAS domain-containing protein [Pseudidiomarina sp.]MDX1705203.1 STAS domain-containing protein [Pseudidiomarina sp.]